MKRNGPRKMLRVVAGSESLFLGGRVAADVEPSEVAADVLRVHEAAASVAYKHIFTGPFPRAEAAERWLTYRGDLLLAVADGATVGFAARSGELLDALYLLPDAAGRGMRDRRIPPCLRGGPGGPVSTRSHSAVVDDYAAGTCAGLNPKTAW